MDDKSTDDAARQIIYDEFGSTDNIVYPDININADNNAKKSIFDTLHDEVLNSDLPEAEKNRRLSVLLRASARKVNLMLVGASGAGKSSTINALFDMNAAKVGVGVESETQEIAKFDLGNLTIWDTPGLGDGIEADKTHIEQIVRKLSETDADGNMLIDLVLVVLDAGSKDMAVSYDVINNTLIPCLGKETRCILIGLNQSDLAMKGRHWDKELNEPDQVLTDYLNQKSDSVKRRIEEATGVAVEPVYYCAGYTDGLERQNPYNLSKLLYYILTAVPVEKRFIIADNLNAVDENWTSNDGDYAKAVKENFWGSFLELVGVGAEKGALIGGCFIGLPGIIFGGLTGAIVGGLHALIIKPFMSFNPLKTLKSLENMFRRQGGISLGDQSAEDIYQQAK
jgi:predicted GTPase